jgi:hypothetical protein
MNLSTPFLNLDERRALLWIRAHQPAVIDTMTPGAPRGKLRHSLMERGYIEFDPKRQMFDPVKYCLTKAGEAALKP